MVRLLSDLHPNLLRSIRHLYVLLIVMTNTVTLKGEWRGVKVEKSFTFGKSHQKTNFVVEQPKAEPKPETATDWNAIGPFIFILLGICAFGLYSVNRWIQKRM